MTSKEMIRNFLIEQEHLKNDYFSEHANPGNNGPYNNIDTPIRNTAHWSIIYSYLYKTEKKDYYKKKAIEYANYICDQQCKNGTIKCINDEKFDNINGLIGQAWVIESLVYVAKTFNIKKYYEVAKKVFFSQKYDEEKKLWIRVDTNGKEIDYDYTTNHQIWFIIAGNAINDYKTDLKIKKICDEVFLNIFDNHFDIHKSGLIKHYLKINNKRKKFSFWYIKKIIKYCSYKIGIRNPEYDLQMQEKGYHVFELFGYSILSKYYKNIINNTKIKRAFNYCIDIDKYNCILNYDGFIKGKYQINKYSYGYNSPAFELPFIMKTFGQENDEKIVELLKIQKIITMENGKMIKNNYDYETLTARAYELIYYLD